MAFEVSKAFDTTPYGMLAVVLCHMGVPKELIQLFHTLGCGSTVRIVTAHGLTPCICLHWGLWQSSAESKVLYLLLMQPLLRSLASKANGDQRHALRPPVQAYSNDLLIRSHRPQLFLEYATIATYLTNMDMLLNLRQCAYATTPRIP